MPAPRLLRYPSAAPDLPKPCAKNWSNLSARILLNLLIWVVIFASVFC